MNQVNLQLNIKAVDGIVYLNQPCLIEVALWNRGETAVLVNKRLSLGFRDQLARELIAAIKDAAGGQPVELQHLSIDRNFSPAADYIELPPGQAITKTVDLFAYYKPEQTGIFTVTLYYQAGEPASRAPADVVRGIYSSNSIELDVRIGKVKRPK